MSGSSTFDPGRYLTKVGQSDYLEVKWRMVWLREVHPEAELATEAVTITAPTANPDGEHEGYAVFKATIRLPGGGSASGYGSETYNDFRDYIEKAETKAIGRACAALGFGTQFCPDFDFGSKPVDSPIDFANTRGRRIAAGERSVDPGRTEPPRDKSTTANTAGSVPIGNDPPQTVENWTDFWKWARTFGLADKAMVEKAIGGTMSHDAGFAYEKLMAWREASTYQPAMPS